MQSFKQWFLEHGGSTSTRAKIGLYPPLYTQVFNYTPQDVITLGPDAITYMAPKDIDPSLPYSSWGKFKPYFWQDSNRHAEDMVIPDPHRIPKSLM